MKIIKQREQLRLVNNWVKVDLFLLFCVLFVPLINLNLPFLGIVDDAICLYFLVAILLKGTKYSFGNKAIWIITLIYLLYSFLLLIYRNLPATSYVQVFITSKFLIIFYYFGYKSKIYKYVFFERLLSLLTVLFILSMLVNVLYFLVPGLYMRANNDVRGLNGITLGGIFFSRTIYSSFLICCIILTINVRDRRNKLLSYITKNRMKILFLCVALLILTFTRKDVLIGVLFIGFFLSFRIKSNLRFVYQGICILFLLVTPFLVDKLFGDINAKTFTEEQVRTQIFYSGLKVFTNYAPFGSGPGTFGSIMSMKYQKVYEQLEIAERIYLGYDQSRGPIFDVFVISLLAEYGIGILLFILLFIGIKKHRWDERVQSRTIDIPFTKSAILIYIIYASTTVPILINGMGLVLFSILATLTRSNRVK